MNIVKINLCLAQWEFIIPWSEWVKAPSEHWFRHSGTLSALREVGVNVPSTLLLYFIITTFKKQLQNKTMLNNKLELSIFLEEKAWGSLGTMSYCNHRNALFFPLLCPYTIVCTWSYVFSFKKKVKIHDFERFIIIPQHIWKPLKGVLTSFSYFLPLAG